MNSRCWDRTCGGISIRRAIAESLDASTRLTEYTRWRTERILAAEHGKDVVRMPSRATFYRLFDKLSHGVHVTGPAAPAARWRTGPMGRSVTSRSRRRASRRDIRM